MVDGELGCFLMLINRKIKILKYWIKIVVSSKAYPLVKQIYNILYNAALNDKDESKKSSNMFN